MEKIFGGIESVIFDTRKLNIKNRDIKNICNYFKIGSPLSYCPEKNILISHSNQIVFLETNNGKYVIKFHKINSPKKIYLECLINSLAKKSGLNVPEIITAEKKPFLKFNDFIVTCYEALLASPLYLTKINSDDVKIINQEISKLNKLLSSLPQYSSIAKLIKKTSFIDSQDLHLSRISKSCNNKSVTGIIRNLRLYYFKNKNKYNRAIIHSNLTLSNLLYDNSRVWILDLSHVALDYKYNDLANFIASCHFFNLPKTKIKQLDFGYYVNDNQLLESFVLNKFIEEYAKMDKILVAKKFTSRRSPGYDLYFKEAAKQKDKILELINCYSRFL